MKYGLFYVILIVSLSFSSSLFSQSWLWARQPFFTGNSSSDGEGYSISTDNQGNVYQTGFFANATMDYGTISLTSAGDAFLVKYDSTGTVQWATQPTFRNGDGGCAAFFTATDISGNVYVTGYFSDTISFGNHTLATPEIEIFLAKYDANGNALWAKQSHTSAFNGNYSMGSGIATDQSGNIYLTGQFQQSATFGQFTLTNPNGGTINQYNFLGSAFLVKYDTNGNVLWAQQGNIPSNLNFASARAVACDANNNVFITGAFHDTISFGNTMLTTQSVAGEIFTAKYDQDGNALWARQTVNSSTQFGTPGPVFGNALTTDKHGSVYVAGNFEDTINFGSTKLISPISFSDYASPYGDMFIAKYDAAGNLSWAKAAYPLTNATYVGWALAADTLDHIYFDAGGWNVYSSAKLTFKIKFNNDTLTATGVPSTESSTFLELDTGGNIICGAVIPFGGDDNTGVAVDPTGTYVFLGGDFWVQNNIIIGPDTLRVDSTQVNSGSEIPFIMRWQPCPTTIPLSIAFTDTNTCPGLCNGKAKANPAGGTAPYRYKWSINIADTLATVSGLCTGSYQVTITDKIGSTITSATTITEPSPVLPVISANKDTICAGDSASLLVTGSTGSIVWQSSSGANGFSNIPGADSVAYSNSFQQTTDLRVTAGNIACPDTSASFILTVLANPVPKISASDTLFCSGDSSLICTSGTYSSYEWSTGNTGSCIEAKDAGGYWVTVTGADGCSAVSNHQQISIYPVSSVSIIVQGDTLSSYNAVDFQWYLDTAVIPGATAPVYIAEHSGSYAVQITDTNGCKELSNYTYVLVVGINQLQGNEGIEIYPNPFSDVIFIKINDPSIKIDDIAIYNVLGQKLLDEKSFNSNPSFINASDFPAGVIFIKVKSGNSYYLGKMIKE